ncbi:hypothetical protein DFH28DRAFT_1127821 [Melampsora americana]|nr:hypothetical protein DFH28DRAFT_1127821 [Melampsora americana]
MKLNHGRLSIIPLSLFRYRTILATGGEVLSNLESMSNMISKFHLESQAPEMKETRFGSNADLIDQRNGRIVGPNSCLEKVAAQSSTPVLQPSIKTSAFENYDFKSGRQHATTQYGRPSTSHLPKVVAREAKLSRSMDFHQSREPRDESFPGPKRRKMISLGLPSKNYIIPPIISAQRNDLAKTSRRVETDKSTAWRRPTKHYKNPANQDSKNQSSNSRSDRSGSTSVHITIPRIVVKNKDNPATNLGEFGTEIEIGLSRDSTKRQKLVSNSKPNQELETKDTGMRSDSIESTGAGNQASLSKEHWIQARAARSQQQELPYELPPFEMPPKDCQNPPIIYSKKTDFPKLRNRISLGLPSKHDIIPPIIVEFIQESLAPRKLCKVHKTPPIIHTKKHVPIISLRRCETEKQKHFHQDLMGPHRSIIDLGHDSKFEKKSTGMPAIISKDKTASQSKSYWPANQPAVQISKKEDLHPASLASTSDIKRILGGELIQEHKLMNENVEDITALTQEALIQKQTEFRREVVDYHRSNGDIQQKTADHFKINIRTVKKYLKAAKLLEVQKACGSIPKKRNFLTRGKVARYPDAYKIWAVEWHSKNGLTQEESALSLGIPGSTLGSWVRTFKPEVKLSKLIKKNKIKQKIQQKQTIRL